MRPVRLCICSRHHWPRVLLETGGTAIYSISDAAAFLSQVAHPMAGSTECKLRVFTTATTHLSDKLEQDNMAGLWLTSDPVIPPDIVVYYCHGGGFSMGSSYFYLEFLLAWVSLLRESGYRSPALFALEYTLVPDAVHPVQLRETVAGYDFVTGTVQDPSRICIAGDSAGATLQLSLLLLLAENSEYRARLPGFSVMISPWVTLVSEKNRDTQSDYLNAASLHCYAQQYAGGKISVHDPLISPGDCKSIELLEKVSLKHGIFFIYGAVEVFAPETRDLVGMLRKAGQEVIVHEERGAVHAWPVVNLFLGSTKAERLKGLKSIVAVIRHRMRCE